MTERRSVDAALTPGVVVVSADGTLVRRTADPLDGPDGPFA
jgi:hypothetical protein